MSWWHDREEGPVEKRSFTEDYWLASTNPPDGLLSYARVDATVLRASVVDFARIRKEGNRLDLSDVGTPDDRKVWCLVFCCAPGGGDFYLLSDGEHYYPIRYYTREKHYYITNRTNLKSSVNVGSLSAFDRMVVKKAIGLAFKEN